MHFAHACCDRLIINFKLTDFAAFTRNINRVLRHIQSGNQHLLVRAPAQNPTTTTGYPGFTRLEGEVA